MNTKAYQCSGSFCIRNVALIYFYLHRLFSSVISFGCTTDADVNKCLEGPSSILEVVGGGLAAIGIKTTVVTGRKITCVSFLVPISISVVPKSLENPACEATYANLLGVLIALILHNHKKAKISSSC